MTRRSRRTQSGPRRLLPWRRTRGPAGAPGPLSRRRWALAFLIVVLVAAAVLGAKFLESFALDDSRATGSGPFCVKIVDLPQWMPRSLAEQIATDIMPEEPDPADLDLTKDIYDRAAANPWIRTVRSVLRCPLSSGTRPMVELEAEFRKPVAMAGNGGRFFFVDADGFRLPEGGVPRWVVTVPATESNAGRQLCYVHESQIPPELRGTRIHYVAIDGVAGEPPAEGDQWTGDDLAAGLKLLGLLLDRRYVNQITVVDVRNYSGRISANQPHLRMYAQIGREKPPTEIRFGRFADPSGGDYVVAADRKISYIDEYVAAHGGTLAGINEYLDLRYDELHVSIN